MEILLSEKQGTERYYEFFKDDTKIGVAYIGFDYDHIYLPKGYETYSNGTYVYGVTIFEQFRNKGYGKKMMDLIIKRSKKPFLWLYCSPSNIPALKIYTNCGFKIIENNYDPVTNEMMLKMLRIRK